MENTFTLSGRHSYKNSWIISQEYLFPPDKRQRSFQKMLSELDDILKDML
jgi:hypothetical protein